MLRETLQHAFLRKAAGSLFLSVCFLSAVRPALAELITIIPLGLPYQSYLGVFNFATAINNTGQVVGHTVVAQPLVTGPDIPFLYSGGVLTNILGINDLTIATANGINNKGQIVGTCTPTIYAVCPFYYAFLISGGQTINLNSIATPPSGYYMATALAINDAGEIVGSLNVNPCSYPFQGCEPQRAYLYANGTVTDLSTLTSAMTPQTATAINNGGQVVGNGLDSAGNDQAFLYSNGTVTELGSLSSALPYSQAQGINNSGEIVGWSHNLGETDEPFLYKNGTFTDLGNLGGPANAYGINNLGQVVGTSSLSPSCSVSDSISFCTSAFLYENGAMIDLNTLLPQNSGWHLTSAMAINDEGQIVGSGQYSGQYNCCNSPYTGLVGFLLDLGSSTVASALSCQLQSILNGPPKQLFVTMQDAASGLQTIHVAAEVNVTVSIPSFSVGATTPVTVTATKVDQSQSSEVAFIVTNTAGVTTSCDPVDFTAQIENRMETHVFRSLSSSEHYVRIVNGKPGLRRIAFRVNGTLLPESHLADKETAVLDIGSAMQEGPNNIVLLEASGKAGASAYILIGDSSVQ